MVCYARCWDTSNVLDWRKMCEDLIFLIDKASTPATSNRTESGESMHSNRAKESEIAHAILRDINNRYHDHIRVYRDREEGASPSDPDHAQRENEQYTRWREEFDFSQSRCSDNLIRRLLEIDGSNDIYDGAGFMLWRVRRLKEMPDEAERGAGVEDAAEHDKPRMSDGQVVQAEPEARIGHNESAVVSGPLAMDGSLAETGEGEGEVVHEDGWHGAADTAMYINVLTHN